MTGNRPCRFCAIAVTLATRTCVRLRARWVGGLSSATFKSPSAALSLSLSILAGRADKHKRQRLENAALRGAARFDRILKNLRQSSLNSKGKNMELLTDEEGKHAVRSARAAIEQVVANKPGAVQKLTPVFSEKRGVFVTLTKDGQLRGCIGLPYPVMPLNEALVHAAKAAALEDPRFPPVRKEELTQIHLEVTILTVPVPVDGDPLQRPKKVIVGKHGLIVRGRGTSGLLLPQVATEYSWDPETFLHQTCIKAGLPAQCWQDNRVELLTFEGQIFSEPE